MNRHERRKAKKFALEVPASAKLRVMEFIDHFHAAPNDADIEIKIGSSGREAAILISFCGAHHAFLLTEARTIADIMEEAMNAHPKDPEGATLPNIILGIRHACAEAEKLSLTN